ncbi:c-type cytochrome [Sphingomonas sp. M1-B02]|uniref:c-type cytochrome n=1 Tax=Sphingomonas sp. M1-B02 TaxID=3114300 RepID=UPI002240CA13|nr:cytochrome c family protein [Sphingomonas sp. S6-11]UZK66657.1 cytochrome c family protein [Sphingomonas sp. S6-11]
MESFDMMQSGSTTRFGQLALCVAASALALAACSQESAQEADTQVAAANETAAPAEAAAPAATAPAPAADNTDTISGVKFAAYTGDATKGKADFATCAACHSVDAGVNKIGPSLHGIVGRKAGTVAGFAYSAANKNSGITWTPEKLFQYLEKPQRVVPGTKMIFPGFPDPQKRADVIAYLQGNT